MLTSGFHVDANGLHAAETLQEGPDQEQIDLCTHWLATHAEPRKAINPKAYSYGLKHEVERWAGRYISNGAFIVAALQAGYRMRPQGLNADFAMTVHGGKV